LKEVQAEYFEPFIATDSRSLFNHPEYLSRMTRENSWKVWELGNGDDNRAYAFTTFLDLPSYLNSVRGRFFQDRFRMLASPIKSSEDKPHPWLELKNRRFEVAVGLSDKLDASALKALGELGALKVDKHTVARSFAKGEDWMVKTPKSARNLIRRSERQGIEVRAVGLDQIDQIVQVRLENCERNNIKAVPQRHFELNLKYLIPKNLMKIWGAYADGELHAIQMVQYDAGVHLLAGIASSDESREKKWQVTAALQSKVMSDAAEIGVILDWVGGDPQAQGKIASIDKYKLSWGGEYVEQERWVK
jgi:hypothetical protein